MCICRVLCAYEVKVALSPKRFFSLLSTFQRNGYINTYTHIVEGLFGRNVRFKFKSLCCRFVYFSDNFNKSRRAHTHTRVCSVRIYICPQFVCFFLFLFNFEKYSKSVIVFSRFEIKSMNVWQIVTDLFESFHLLIHLMFVLFRIFSVFNSKMHSLL